jgi:tyrosine-protein kinase
MSTDTQTNPGADSLARAALRRAWLVVLCAVVGAAVAYGLSENQPKQYTATASLLFQQSEFSQDLFGFSASQLIDPTTEQATSISLASQPVISLLTARRLGGGLTYHDIASVISVVAANEGQVIDIDATTASPTTASKIANAYANQVIAYQQLQNEVQVDQAASSLRKQIATLPATSAEAKALQARLRQLEALASLETAGVQVAGQALTPTFPSGPHTKRAGALGLLLGLLIGLVGALLLERRDKRIRDIADATDLIGVLPVLGVLPQVRKGAEARITEAGAAGFAEALRLLRAQLRYFGVDGQVKSVLVTSPTPGDGKSTLAWNLAATYAVADPQASVLLIDADLRRPRATEISGLPAGPGLSDVLSGAAGVEDAIRQTVILNPNSGKRAAELHVLGAGGLPPNPAQLLESSAFSSFLAAAKRDYDFVVLDSPPVSQVSDSIPALRLVDGVLIVVRMKLTHRGALRLLIAQLEQLSAPVLGVVINGATQGSSGYGYGYGYGYGHYYNAPVADVATENPLAEQASSVDDVAT